MSRKLLLLAAVALVFFGPRAGAQRAGFFSRAQAERGHAVYERACSTCHGADLSGDEPAEVPALAGERFDQRWRGEPLQALFDKASKTMPADHPGTLAPSEYADILAYVLEANGLPSGPEELRADAAALGTVIPPLAKRTP